MTTDTLELADTTAVELTAPLNRLLPWDGIVSGRTGDELMTSEELLEKAGLNWEVAKRPMMRRLTDGTVKESTMTYEVYRTTDEYELGSVKGHYEVYQNRDAFAFGDLLVNDGRARWVEAGSQVNDSRIFMVMQLTDTFTVGDRDEVTLFLFMRTSHDGSSAVSGFITPIRFFCTNQLQLIQDTALARFKFQHRSNIQARIAEATTSFQQAVQYQVEFQALANRLVATRVEDQTARRLVEAVFPEDRARREDMIEGVLTTYQTSPTVGDYRGTAYGLLNGLTEYMDHKKVQRTVNARFESIMLGEGARVRRALTQKLVALTG